MQASGPGPPGGRPLFDYAARSKGLPLAGDLSGEGPGRKRSERAFAARQRKAAKLASRVALLQTGSMDDAGSLSRAPLLLDAPEG